MLVETEYSSLSDSLTCDLSPQAAADTNNRSYVKLKFHCLQAECKTGKTISPILACVLNKRVTFYALKICFMSVYDVKLSTPTAVHRCDTWCLKTGERFPSLSITRTWSGEYFEEVYFLQPNKTVSLLQIFGGGCANLQTDTCKMRWQGGRAVRSRLYSGSLCWFS